MKKTKTTLIAIFLLGFSNIIFSEDIVSQPQTQEQSSPANENKDASLQEPVSNSFPKFQLTAGYATFGSSGSGFIPYSQSTNLLDFYQGTGFQSNSMIVNFHWFFAKNMGLSLAFEKNDDDLLLTTLNGIDETHKFFIAYNGYLGFQYRVFTGDEIILGKLLGLKSSFNHCCSLFAEAKAGFVYLMYNNDYINILKTSPIDNFPVNESRRDFPGMALKYRLGASFYFPLVVLEISVGEAWFLLNNHGKTVGFQGVNWELSAGIYF